VALGGSIRLLDAATLNERWRTPPPKGSFNLEPRVEFDAAGQRVVNASSALKIAVWSVSEGRELYQVLGTTRASAPLAGLPSAVTVGSMPLSVGERASGAPHCQSWIWAPAVLGCDTHKRRRRRSITKPPFAGGVTASELRTQTS
jgi:hypothetical protein